MVGLSQPLARNRKRLARVAAVQDVDGNRKMVTGTASVGLVGVLHDAHATALTRSKSFAEVIHACLNAHHWRCNTGMSPVVPN